jgi:ParB family chromosome partitioning protein
VSNLIRLLDLPAEVVGLIDSKALSMGHARALLGLENDAERLRLGRVVAERGYSVRETEALVRKAGRGGTGRAGAPRPQPELSVVSEVLRTAAVHVQLQQKASGAARIVVDVADGKSRDEVIRAIRAALGQ